MPVWSQRLDALAVPSLTMPNWKEQFGRVIIEAMAAAVPVVGSDSGEIPRVIGDAGLVTPEGDAGALAEALQLLMDDEAERQRLALRGASGRWRTTPGSGWRGSIMGCIGRCWGEEGRTVPLPGAGRG